MSLWIQKYKLIWLNDCDNKKSCDALKDLSRLFLKCVYLASSKAFLVQLETLELRRRWKRPMARSQFFQSRHVSQTGDVMVNLDRWRRICWRRHRPNPSYLNHPNQVKPKLKPNHPNLQSLRSQPVHLKSHLAKGLQKEQHHPRVLARAKSLGCNA